MNDSVLSCFLGIDCSDFNQPTFLSHTNCYPLTLSCVWILTI